MKFSGVNLDDGTQVDICQKVLENELPIVPLSYDPELKYTGLTIDPDEDLQLIREHKKSSGGELK